jgi:hypothetical protein
MPDDMRLSRVNYFGVWLARGSSFNFLGAVSVWSDFPIFSPTAVCDHKWDSQRKIPWNIIEQLVVPLLPNPLITLSR